MASVAGEVVNYDLKSGKRDRLLLQARATITGAGGVVVQPLTWQDDPGITIVRGASAGLYNVTFPKAADAIGSVSAEVVSPLGTVRAAYPVSFDPQAGLATIQTSAAAGGAADPAAGDSVIVTLLLSMRKDF